MKLRRYMLQNLGRQIRAKALRLLMRFTVLVCHIEDRLRPPALKTGKHVLMIVFGGLGDCLLFGPLFTRIKEQWAGARVDVLTSPFDGMWRGLDGIDQLIYFGHARFKSPRAYFELFRTIHRGRYDVAVEALGMLPRRGTWSILTGLMLEASGAPLRVGRHTTGRLVYRRNREYEKSLKVELDYFQPSTAPSPASMHPSINRLIELPPPQRRTQHESHFVAKAMGIELNRRPHEPRLRVNPVEALWAHKLIRLNTFAPGDVVVGLVAEATYALKRWPRERFRAIVERGACAGMKFVLLGRHQQDSVLDLDVPPGHVVDLTGATTLERMIAVISECDVFLSADTGPAHVAQACGVPTVVIFGPSNDGEFGPVDHERHIRITPTEALPCRPCVMGPCVRGETCMNLISVDTVYAALEDRVRAVTAARNPANRALA